MLGSIGWWARMLSLRNSELKVEDIVKISEKAYSNP